MIDEKMLKEYFEKNEVSNENIIHFAKFFYEKASFSHGKLLSTNYFLQTVKLVAQKLNLSLIRIQALQFKLYDTIKGYRIREGQTVKVAEIKSPLMIRKIIRQLWFNTKPETVRSRPYIYQKMILRRITAVQTLLVSVTGRRWIDITRLRWEFSKIHHLEHATFIKIGIFISKPNKKGRRNESITIVKDDTDLCPVKILISYWILMGRPKFGWIFPCVHKNRVFKTHSLYDQWSDWCCTIGHRQNGKRLECLGHINGDVTEGMMKRTALKVGFTSPPTKHTFRRTLVVMALKLGMNRERICEYFGWNYDSHMISHYIQDTLGTDKQGLPFMIAQNLLSKEFLNDIVIEN